MTTDSKSLLTTQQNDSIDHNQICNDDSQEKLMEENSIMEACSLISSSRNDQDKEDQQERKEDDNNINHEQNLHLQFNKEDTFHDLSFGNTTLFRLLNTNISSDEMIYIRGIRLYEGIHVIKFLKFLFVTMGFITITHTVVRSVEWENDGNYSLVDFVQYDLPHVCLDTFTFFTVGRLYERKGVDRMSFILPIIVGCLQPSWESNWKFLQHSVSLYDIHCTWPWSLYVFVLLLTILIGRLVYAHIRHTIQNKIFVSRIFEFLLCITFFLCPYISNPNFHLHHWYASWLFGMHSNLDPWWSDLTLSFAWGTYMNGIAVYGRDPILSCAYSFYISTDNRCSYMECYALDDEVTDDGTNGYKPFESPDWRNCSAQ